MRHDKQECVMFDAQLTERHMMKASCMAKDYDAPRASVEDELETDSLEGLKSAEASLDDMDDDGEIVESFDLPTLDLSGEELSGPVVPRREDEFTCSSCFIVQRKNRIDHVEDDGSVICQDCA